MRRMVVEQMQRLSAFFRSWPLALQADLSRHLMSVPLVRAEVVFQQGGRPDRMYFVLNGQVGSGFMFQCWDNGVG
jgi:hypothetical protein